MKKRQIIFVMLLCCMMFITPMEVLGQDSSKEKPDVTISSAEELRAFATKVNNGNTYDGKLIKLTKDIHFNPEEEDNFTPIGIGKYAKKQYQKYLKMDFGTWYDEWIKENEGFSGTFDGGGHIISGLNQSDMFGGLFGYVALGSVENVTIKNATFQNIVGGSIAFINEGFIRNCHNRSKLIGDWVSGIALWNDMIITDCSNIGVISPTGNTHRGGIVAVNDGMIVNCYNAGNIIISDNDNYGYGGIAGYNGDDEEDSESFGWMMNCYNIGRILGRDGNNYAGIVGCAYNGIIQSCYYAKESAVSAFELVGDHINLMGNQRLTKREMATKSFVTLLNEGAEEFEIIKWELNHKTNYPTLMKLREVTFKNIKNGVIHTDNSYAYQGQKVTLIVVPKKNYKLKTMSIKTTSGKTIKYKKVKGEYRFTMPKSKVVVTASFKKK